MVRPIEDAGEAYNIMKFFSNQKAKKYIFIIYKFMICKENNTYF